jgi:hypothetical protein
MSAHARLAEVHAQLPRRLGLQPDLKSRDIMGIAPEDGISLASRKYMRSFAQIGAPHAA